MLIGWVWSCSEDEGPLQPIHPSLLDEVRYVSLVPDAYSNQEIMVLNGQASFGLTMHQFDRDKKLLYKNLPQSSVVRVSDGTLLKYPFQFKPKSTGRYTFTLEGYPARNVIQSSVSVVVLDDMAYDQVTMPVIFHYFASPDESVPVAEMSVVIAAQLEKVNRAYANQNGSRDPNCVDSHISFVPATEDPEGGPLVAPGLNIVRSAQVKFKDSNDDKLHEIIWDGNFWSPRRYVNVWLARFEGNYSWARFPYYGATSAEFPSSAYGTFLKYEHLPFASVLAHEFGHMLNLYHNFDDECRSDVDLCRDTRDYQRDYSSDFKGGLVRQDCKGVEFTGVNYMDYYPTENNTFTYEQRKRMRTTLVQCPFLPTPANQAGRSAARRSHPKMSWQVDPVTLSW